MKRALYGRQIRQRKGREAELRKLKQRVGVAAYRCPYPPRIRRVIFRVSFVALAMIAAVAIVLATVKLSPWPP